MVQQPTRVVHCKKEKYDIYIGRPSIFGNPFEIGKDGNREEVIQKYKIYFQNRLIKDNNFWRKIQECKGKILGCWCKPLPCHGDIIEEYLNARN
jgi:hypothetical protein